MAKKTVIIGLDGVPFGLLKNLAETGIMPNTAKLIANGTFKKMSSSIPEISSVAWSSIITGTNPGEHGIFGFTDFAPGTYQFSFPNFSNLKKPPFWTKIAGKSVIINVPSTYPVKEMNGIHISGFVSIHPEKSTYPSSLLPKLKELNYRIDVDSAKAHKSLELFLVDLEQTLKARIKTYRYLWEKDWQTFILVFTGTDRLMHFLWNAYEDKEHQHHQDFLDHFHQIDEVIGEINNKMSNGDSLIMLSDHGFEGLDKEVYINYFLKKEGFLKLEDTDEPTGTDIDYPTKAFALDPARIYLNLKDRYPRGSVRAEDKEMTELVHPVNHEPTWQSVVAERAFLNALGVGCRAPVAALGTMNGNTLTLQGMVATTDGSKILWATEEGDSLAPEQIGKRLAQRMVDIGALQLITEVGGR